MQTGLPCTVMRGGTSKGLYFLRADLPGDTAERDRLLLAAMGSPNARQIDGMGGAHPLTSKVAIVGPATRPDADVDYLFLQVVVDRPEVSDSQNCGNLLAGVGPFAIERGLVDAHDGETDVRIHMVNTSSLAIARVQTPGGNVEYAGAARIDGVPGTAAPVKLDFVDAAGASCGALLPTGTVRDTVQGVDVTCIDNGMPVVVLRASDFGLTGYEAPAELEADEELKAAYRNNPARARAAHESRRRREQDRAEDEPGRVGSRRRRDLHAHVHPAPGTRSDRRARRGQRRQRMPAAGVRCRRRRATRRGPRARTRSTSNTRPARSAWNSSWTPTAHCPPFGVRHCCGQPGN